MNAMLPPLATATCEYIPSGFIPGGFTNLVVMFPHNSSRQQLDYDCFVSLHAANQAAALFSTSPNTYCSSLPASTWKRRIPSASLSVAMASSLCNQQNAFSSTANFSPELAFADSNDSRRVSEPSVFSILSSRSGAIVSKSQPARPVICSTLRKLAPITCVP